MGIGQNVSGEVCLGKNLDPFIEKFLCIVGGFVGDGYVLSGGSESAYEVGDGGIDGLELSELFFKSSVSVGHGLEKRDSAK